MYEYIVSIFHHNDRKRTQARSKGEAMPESNASNAFIREESRERKPKANSQEL